VQVSAGNLAGCVGLRSCSDSSSYSVQPPAAFVAT